MKNIIAQWKIYIQSRQTDQDRLTLFEHIWEHYYQKLCLFVRSYVYDRDTCMDTVHDIMLKVFENITDYNPLFSFNTWIYRIARNHCIDQGRKKRDIICEQEHLEHRSDGNGKKNDPLHQVLQREQMTLLDTFITGLSEDEQEIAFLKFYEKLSYTDISRIITMPEGTIRYKVHRIRQSLKRYWENHYE